MKDRPTHTKNKLFFVVQVVFVVFILLSCSTTNNNPQTTNWDLSAIYNPLVTYLHPSYKVYHNGQNQSVLFLKIRKSELFFRENVLSGYDECSFTINFYLKDIDPEVDRIVDTNTYIYRFRNSDMNDYYVSQIPLKAEMGKSYKLKIILKDNNRVSSSIHYIDIEKKKQTSEQFFNLTQINGSPLFSNIILNNGVFRINHMAPTSSNLYISYFGKEAPSPQPFINPLNDTTLFKKADTIYSINYSQSQALTLPDEGMYFIQFDTNSKEGISILKRNNDFPKVESPVGLIPPLEYITTDAKFKKLIKETNEKLAADNFWLEIGKNPDKSRQLIRIFYNRVYFANYYFSNTKPGWKTDRGMVYVVYGPPHRLTKSNDTETWYYNQKGVATPIEFTFHYEPNKFTVKEYKLQRSSSNNWHWTEAVYAWNTGDIFIYD